MKYIDIENWLSTLVMRSFNELQEGDKIFAFANKSIKRTPSLGEKFSWNGGFISGAYNITKIINSGFLIKFELVSIIGTPLSDILINKNAKFSVTRVYYWSYGFNMCEQEVIFTTLEEEWLKMINDEEV